MSGQVYDVGSVMNFYPCEPRTVDLPGGGDHPLSGTGLRYVGYATVVVDRDGWVVRTELRAAVQDRNGKIMISEE